MYGVLIVISVILVLLVVVGLHEAGHAIAAFIFNVKIQRISIGFGRPLIKWTRKNIEWVWALWPLGGYVQLLNSRIEPLSAYQKKYAFDKKSAFVRITILLAGVIANLLVAFIAFLLIFMIGFKQIPPIIGEVKEPSIASVAGLSENDRILSIANASTPSLRDSAMELIKNLGKSDVPIVIKSGSNIKNTSLNLKDWKYTGKEDDLFDALGIVPDISQKLREHIPGEGFFNSTIKSFNEIRKLLYFFIVILKQIFTGVLPFAVLLGPMGIFETIANSFLQGVVAFLYLLGTLSVSVALINIIPLPGLDGGSILYTIIEKIRGKPLSIAMEILLYRLTLIVFAVILVQLLLNDLKRYIA